MIRGAGRWAQALIAATLVAIVSGCTIMLEQPQLELLVPPAFNRRDVLIPYEVTGGQGEAWIEWEISRYRPALGVWEVQRTWSFGVPSGTAGTVPADLDDALYEIDARVLVNRGGLSPANATLERSTGFYVDTWAPEDGITLAPLPGPGQGAGLLEVDAIYNGTPDPDFESSVALYYNLDTPRRPNTDDELVTGPILLWEAGGAPAGGVLLSVIAIDEAGNSGSYVTGVYQP